MYMYIYMYLCNLHNIYIAVDISPADRLISTVAPLRNTTGAQLEAKAVSRVFGTTG